jgi:hypothetical protein
MASYHVQVTIPSDTALPENSVVNGFNFLGPDIPTGGDGAALQARILSFYNDIHAPGTNPISGRLSGTALNGAEAFMKVYRRSDPVPRVPVLNMPLNIATSGGTPLPNEVCVVMSYRASQLSGTPQARRRGRIYIGPLVATAGQAGNGDVFVSPVFRQDVAGAGAWLVSQSDATWTWIVHSSLAGDATVVGGWVDDTFDTQRRRGLAGQVRTLF